MAKIRGLLIECCRCKKQIFVAQTKGDVYNYVEKPEGWGSDCTPEISDLCPECLAEWERVKEAFMQIPIDKP